MHDQLTILIGRKGDLGLDPIRRCSVVPYVFHTSLQKKKVINQENFTPPATTQLSLPINYDRCLHGLLAYLFCCDVVPQSVEGPADEGWLLIKAGPPGGQALGRGWQ